MMKWSSISFHFCWYECEKYTGLSTWLLIDLHLTPVSNQWLHSKTFILLLAWASTNCFCWRGLIMTSMFWPARNMSSMIFPWMTVFSFSDMRFAAWEGGSLLREVSSECHLYSQSVGLCNQFLHLLPALSLFDIIKTGRDDCSKVCVILLQCSHICFHDLSEVEQRWDIILHYVGGSVGRIWGLSQLKVKLVQKLLDLIAVNFDRTNIFSESDVKRSAEIGEILLEIFLHVLISKDASLSFRNLLHWLS